ncbi:tRNA (adenosine(37)-N6)-threonylcarbamoyltransferase complex dimerization subunit type 1 TsaB [Mesobaculum littorinae]|uniref:tRNA (Adenosine(37)-N6)-threonylcarbamoyltransferase complex dimerization subunit type 1 TsaB n=1 Tax=Mesobaculum littorinae TaxID=2486419 RepID=A0A438AD84_9RHOB|nr:tRNA (adenosine(37)-N6)-threonylcarbamoyltransferase complex dimerization subunit type 1 TsaB [Mesobaculum littorinae]RVV96660.1 tRNA (adenosine(37)-N6)-threonylcarbamoyltransferase complex dimerization subunit type 1 TsaB [Mesobaculum littorinae]
MPEPSPAAGPDGGLVLGFDTSAAHCAAALLSGDTVIAARTEEMSKGQAERLFPLLEEILAEGGAGWSDLARIGVGTGPGNFTGVRIAVAAARGLSLSLKIPAIGVTMFDALAHGTDAPVLVSLDGRRGTLLIAPPDGAPIIATEDTLPEGLSRPGLTCLGHAAAPLARRLDAQAGTPAYPAAVAIARLAARATPPFDRPAPLYLRPADAAPPRDAPPQLLP